MSLPDLIGQSVIDSRVKRGNDTDQIKSQNHLKILLFALPGMKQKRNGIFR